MQSSMNCVNCLSGGKDSSRLSGEWLATVFSRSGKSLSLVSLVPLHRVSRWTMSSVGVCAGAVGLSARVMCKVMKVFDSLRLLSKIVCLTCLSKIV